MAERLPKRIRVEVGLAVPSADLALLTLIWKDWIEIVFRVDPDHGDGSAEWWVVAGLAVVAVAGFALSRWELRRLDTATAP